MAASLYRDVPAMPAEAALSGLVRSVLRHEAAGAAVLSHTYTAGPDRFNAWRDGAPLLAIALSLSLRLRLSLSLTLTLYPNPEPNPKPRP